MNKYFKFTVESDLGVGTQYIEFDDDNWAIRQAECHEGRWFNSSTEKYHSELGGISLFDQQLTELGMQRGKSIDAQEFESFWTLSNTKLIEYQSINPNQQPISTDKNCGNNLTLALAKKRQSD
jgi:hypothetical protein